MTQKIIPNTFGEHIKKVEVGTHIEGVCDPDVLCAIQTNGGYVQFNDTFHLARKPHVERSITGLYLGEVDIELWRVGEAERAIESARGPLGWFQSIDEKRCLCYILETGQRLLHVQNLEDGWESFLVLIAHVRREGCEH